MREIRTFFCGTACTFWLDGAEDLYLDYEPGEEKEGGFILVEYDDKIYRSLKSHPNFPRVFPRFTIEGEEGCYMALKKHGQSLENFLKGNDKKFYSNGQITNFYQHILIDLLLVVDHCIRSEIECILDLSSIYVVDEPTPHLTLTKFKSRDGKVSNDVWKNAGTIIKDINKSTCGAAYLNGEMKTLLNSLEKADKVSLAEISHLPLFWSSEQRRFFICDMWHEYEYSCHNLVSHNFQPFGGDSKAALSKMKSDVKLSGLLKEVDKYPAIAIPDGNEEASRYLLHAVYLCLSRFREAKARITRNGGDVDFNNEGELLKYIDGLFKDFVHELYHFAVFLEANYSTQHLVPRNKALDGTF